VDLKDFTNGVFNEWFFILDSKKGDRGSWILKKWSVMVSVLLGGRGVVGDDRRRLDHRVLRNGKESD
jgi:hypothetical protein